MNVMIKWLILVGFGLICMGVILWLFNKSGLPLGKLPGDFLIKKEKLNIYFPLATSIILSILLTLTLNFILWLFRK